MIKIFFFFQAEDGIRDAQESRGLGDVYKRQSQLKALKLHGMAECYAEIQAHNSELIDPVCLLYTSDAADDLTRVDVGVRRIIKKKKKKKKNINTNF